MRSGVVYRLLTICQLNPFVFQVQMDFEQHLKPFYCELLVRNILEYLQGFIRKLSEILVLFYQLWIKYVS